MKLLPFNSGFPTVGLVLCMAILINNSQSIRFHIQPHSKRCLSHEMYPNQLAVGSYEVSNQPGQMVDMKITDSKGHVALSRDSIEGKGKFAVTSDTSDFYELCFAYTTSPGSAAQSNPIEIFVDYKVGPEAKQLDPVDQDTMSILDTNLNRIEDLTNSVIVDFAYLKKREQEMRDTNESTNTRLFYQTLTSLIIVLVLATWQILYLRTFFRSRKLID